MTFCRDALSASVLVIVCRDEFPTNETREPNEASARPPELFLSEDILNRFFRVLAKQVNVWTYCRQSLPDSRYRKNKQWLRLVIPKGHHGHTLTSPNVRRLFLDIGLRFRSRYTRGNN